MARRRLRAAPPVRAAVAKRIFHSAVGRIPLRVVETGGRSYGGGDAADPVFRLVRPTVVLPPPRRHRHDRLRRGLHGRRLDRRRPGRGAVGVRREHARARAGDVPPAAPRRAAPPARARGQHRRGRPRQHPPPLRPVQRPVQDVPRRVHDLLLGGVRRRALRRRPTTSPMRSAARSTGCSTSRTSARAPGCSRSAPVGASWRSARRPAAPRSRPSRSRSSRPSWRASASPPPG